MLYCCTLADPFFLNDNFTISLLLPFQAIAGECQKNKKYMITNCAPACMTCDMLTIDSRCPIDPDAKAAWSPGDLNILFERLVSEEMTSKYNVTILSKPPEPWIVIADDVVTEEECKRLIKLGDLEGKV